MTETGGGATTMVGPDEAKHYGSAGRLTANMEAKIVDPSTGEALLPGKEGELWLRGPNVMKGDALVPNFPTIFASVKLAKLILLHYGLLYCYCFSLTTENDSRNAGYVGDIEATVATFSSDGWLKTGDICYFDSEGFLFIVDRLKELIKYKAYQVINF